MAITLRAGLISTMQSEAFRTSARLPIRLSKTAADGAKRADNAVDELARSEERAGDAAESTPVSEPKSRRRNCGMKSRWRKTPSVI